MFLSGSRYLALSLSFSPVLKARLLLWHSSGLQAGQEKESPAGQPRAYDAASDDEDRPPNELSGSSSETESSSSTEADGCKFAVGMPVEVMRTDGLWTLCTVVEYDAAGGTYTVQLADGRRKYFVEPDWLRLPAFLFQSSAII